MEASGTLRFEPNVPVDVALKYEAGKPVTSLLTKAPQVMFTLISGQKMYLDPDVAARVDGLKVKRGEAFVICKVGKGKDAQWAVSRKAGEARPAAPAPPATYPPKPVDTPGQTTARRILADQASVMSSALKAAVSAAMDAEAYAKSLGFVVKFTPADITQLTLIAARMQAGAR